MMMDLGEQLTDEEVDGMMREAAVDVPMVSERQASTTQKVPKKSHEVPQEQYIDRTVDVPAVTQDQVHTFQTVRKEPQVQFLDRVLDAPVAMQRHATHEQIQERIVEEDHVSVRHMMEKTIEVTKLIPQERVQNDTVERIVDLPVPRIWKETGEVTQLIPEWLNFVKGVVGSEHLPLNISHETLQRNKILRVIKKTYVKRCLGILAEIADKENDYKRFYMNSLVNT